MSEKHAVHDQLKIKKGRTLTNSLLLKIITSDTVLMLEFFKTF